MQGFLLAKKNEQMHLSISFYQKLKCTELNCTWLKCKFSQFEAREKQRVSYHPKPPNDTLLFLLYMLTTPLSLSVLPFLCQWQTEDFTCPSTLLGQATRGKSKGQEGRKADVSSYLFSIPNHHHPLHLPLYFINVSVCGFLGHTSNSLYPAQEVQQH